MLIGLLAGLFAGLALVRRLRAGVVVRRWLSLGRVGAVVGCVARLVRGALVGLVARLVAGLIGGLRVLALAFVVAGLLGWLFAGLLVGLLGLAVG